MKKLFLAVCLLLAMVAEGQTQGNAPIPEFWVGTWLNPINNDTISITTEKITWVSHYIDFSAYVSYVDYVLFQDATYFHFYAYPSVHVLSFEKISRVKMIFHAQTHEGYLRSDGIYIKQGTRAN